MVMSLSEWQIKTLFIAHSGALEQACHRVSRQRCAPAWMKIQHGKNFLKWNSIAFATKQQNMHWRNHQQSLGFDWLVKAVLRNDRIVAQQSRLDKKTPWKEKFCGWIMYALNIGFLLYNYYISSIWDLEMFWLLSLRVEGWTGTKGRQWRYWRWCGGGGRNPWLSCADWSLRAQLVLDFHPSSWARVFCGPLQSSLKEDSRVQSLHEALRTLPLQPHTEERRPRCRPAESSWKTLGDIGNRWTQPQCEEYLASDLEGLEPMWELRMLSIWVKCDSNGGKK